MHFITDFQKSLSRVVTAQYRGRNGFGEVQEIQQFIKRRLTDPLSGGHIDIAPQETELFLAINGISDFLSFLYPHQINHLFRKRLRTLLLQNYSDSI